MINIKDTQTKLENLADDRDISKTNVASRLRTLSAAIGGDPSVGDWTDIDIYKVINVEAITENAKASMVPEPWLRFLEWSRNVLILAPLVFTWLSIWQATQKYATLLANDNTGKLALTPFLYLWEQGFNKTLWDGFTLSNLAIFDFLLLSLIIILTGIVTWRYSITNAQREHRAYELKVELTDTLSDTIFCLASRQQQQPKDMAGVVKLLSKVSKDFKRTTEEFLKELASERQQRGSLNDFSTALDKTAKEMVTAANTIRQTNGDLALTIKDLVGPIHEIPELVQAAGQAVSHLDNMFGTLQQLVTDQARWQKDLQTNLTSKFDNLLQEQKKAAQDQYSLLSRCFTDLQTNLTSKLDGLLQEQKKAAQDQHLLLSERFTDLQTNLTSKFDSLLQEQQKAAQDQYSLLSERFTEQKETALQLQAGLKSMLDQIFAHQQSFDRSLYTMIETSLQNLIKEQKQLGNGLTDAADTLEDASKQIVSTVKTLEKFMNGQENALKKLDAQHEIQVKMTERINEITAETHHILKTTREAIPELRSMSIDINNFVGALNQLPQTLEKELLKPLKSYANAAAKIDTGSQTLELAAGRLHAGSQTLELAAGKLHTVINQPNGQFDL